jgi:hypothetical protein
MAATREQVLQAYQNNPFATPFPDEGAIQYWMSTGLDNFDSVVQQVRAANPALAAEIDNQRAEQAAISTPQQFSGLFSSGNVLENQAQQVLAASGKANDPRFADAIVGSFVQDGVTYNVQGDGSIQGIIETPTGAYLAGGFTPTGQQATEQLSTRFEETDLDRALGILANAAIAAGTGFALGPAGVGALGVPGAAAAGAGITNFANTGDLQAALKAAALGGVTAFGANTLLGSLGSGADLGTALDLTVADDISQLAASGLGQDQIANIISNSYGIDPFSAAESVASTLGSSSVSPATVTVTGNNLGALSGLAPSVVSTLPSILPQVQVTGQTINSDLTVPAAVATTIPAVLGGTVQQVNVTGQNIPKTEPVIPPVILPPPTPTTPPAPPPTPPAPPPTTPDTVEVVGKKDTTVIPPVILPPPAPPVPPSPPPKPPKPPAPPTPPDAPVKPTDLLTLLSLLNIGGTLGNLGNTPTTQTVGIPQSDTKIGSTTPQFGPDYYAAVQQYYNAYMPETPRNVAGPLQQWYENKYGA